MKLNELLIALQSQIDQRRFGYETLALFQKLGESAIERGDRRRADLQLQNVKDQCEKIRAIEAEIGRLCREVTRHFNREYCELVLQILESSTSTKETL